MQVKPLCTIHNSLHILKNQMWSAWMAACFLRGVYPAERETSLSLELILTLPDSSTLFNTTTLVHASTFMTKDQTLPLAGLSSHCLLLCSFYSADNHAHVQCHECCLSFASPYPSSYIFRKQSGNLMLNGRCLLSSACFFSYSLPSFLCWDEGEIRNLEATQLPSRSKFLACKTGRTYEAAVYWVHLHGSI